MPAEQFTKEWNFNLDASEGHRVMRMALKFDVSAEAARYRTIELGLLS